MEKTCPNWEVWSDEIRDDICINYGNYSGLCFGATPYQSKKCPWKGKKNEIPEAQA